MKNWEWHTSLKFTSTRSLGLQVSEVSQASADESSYGNGVVPERTADWFIDWTEHSSAEPRIRLWLRRCSRLTRKLYSTLIDRRSISNDLLHPCGNLITGTEQGRLGSKRAKRLEGSMIKTVTSHFLWYRSNRCDGKIRLIDSDLFGLEMILKMINDAITRNNG